MKNPFANLTAMFRRRPSAPMRIKFRKTHVAAKIPRRGSAGAAGFDLTAVSYEIKEGKACYSTGIAVEIPPGHVGLIFPHSSIHRYSQRLSNAVGVIDSDYRGEITAIFDLAIYCATTRELYITGDRIAQLVIVPVPAVEFVEVAALSNTARGNGGYGSTGK